MPFAQRVVTPIYMSRKKRVTTSTNTTTTIVNGGGGKLDTNDNTTQIDNGRITTGNVETTTITVGATNASTGTTTTAISDYEFEAVTNLTLSNALRQLASLVLIANDIFTELNKELSNIGDRTRTIKQRIDTLDKKVEEFDPKLVTVPESDLVTFAHIKNHYKKNRPIETSLFTPATRSTNLQHLYDAAAKTPINAMEEMDRILGKYDHHSSDIFICTPVLGQARRRMKANIDVEIETRMPAAVEELRKWTSSEAIGDITVAPHCITKVGFTSSQSNDTLVNSGFNFTVGILSDVTDNNTTSISRINEVTCDMPLDHRLPSPEEQCQMIALRFPSEVIKVDTSGKRFERMCTARKSMNNIVIPIGEQNNLNDEIQTVKRRSRSRKPRHKRRNTIAGTDQKEIEEAINGEIETTCTTINTNDSNKYVPRSKSNDILKKDSPSTESNSKTMPRMSHFNTLKQWGRNRLRLINRNSSNNTSSTNDDHNKKDSSKDKVFDIDDINVYETVISKNKRKFMEKERKLSHERKPSYSSSERSLTITSNSQQTHLPASVNPVKLRESSALRRQRRSGLGHKDEPNSSSGNWSASSESGRTSIGSEITAQPKSSASSTSLNHSHHPGSGPPSSIISRRRFLNTSASSSVTSEGTVTPDIQVHDPYDDETSSAYSCDTEGYYTSFHVDSGLKTLKEEEPVTPLHTTSALSSTNSFSSSSNKTVLSVENEYELFGKGSTSTTASSAGTVCTTLMAAHSDRCLIVNGGPAVPERKSSLTKLHRSNSNASNSTLERSYSSSTVGSTLERSGTIKRNGILLEKKVSAVVHETQQPTRIESPDSGNNTSSSPIETNSNSSPTQGIRSNSEYDYSECSDLENVERVERIRIKTTINSSRIPSLCVITPSNSEDEDNIEIQKLKSQRKRFASPVKETHLDALEFDSDTSPKQTTLPHDNKLNIPITVKSQTDFKKEVQHIKKATLLPLNNMFGKLRGVLPQLKKSPIKDVIITPEEPLYDNAGEYVTISDMANNNQKKPGYYVNDILKRNLATVLSGNLNEETEYVSLNELPANIRCESNLVLTSGFNSPEEQKDKINNPANGMNENCSTSSGSSSSNTHEDENLKNRGARVTLDAQGKVVYSSDSLKRRKGAHTTFVPGPYVKNTIDTTSNSHSAEFMLSATCATQTTVGNGGDGSGGGILSHRRTTTVRPVISQSLHKPIPQVKFGGGGVNNNKQVDKIIIRADNQGSGANTEIIRMPVATVVAASSTTTTTPSTNICTTASTIYSSEELSGDMASNTGNLLKGAYVNIQGKTHGFDHNNHHASSNNQLKNINNENTDYHRSSHDETDAKLDRAIFKASTISRFTSDEFDNQQTARSASPFQRSNNIYWTLQTGRKQAIEKTELVKPVIKNAPIKNDASGDDGGVVVIINQKPTSRPIEELYSTPNKIKNRKSELRPTPLGFSTFFSPVSKLTTSDNILSQNNTTKISPIDPRNTGSFHTSTPSKLDGSTISTNLSNELRNKLHIQEGLNNTQSATSTPTSSGRSTPRIYLEPQSGRHHDSNDLSQTCLDRLGTPKTSLMDFKKLLLSKATKSSDRKSAVELLKISKDTAKQQQQQQQSPASLTSTNQTMNILDLSGSPKTFANRRMIRQGNFGSPSKQLANTTVKHMSPRSTWKFNNFRTDVMSTAIPEVNSEEDSSPNNSTERHHVNTTVASTKKSPSVVEENIDMKGNIFLQAEENNFMKGEQLLMNKPVVSLSRAQLLTQARAQFLMAGNLDAESSSVQSQLKIGHCTSKSTRSPITFSNSIDIEAAERLRIEQSTPPSLETAL